MLGGVARFRRVANAALTVACLGVAAASVRNVYGESDEVEPLARAQASCPEGLCQLTRVDRTPFGQTLAFHKQGATLIVRCARSALLVGPYECVRAAPLAKRRGSGPRARRSPGAISTLCAKRGPMSRAGASSGRCPGALARGGRR